MFLAIQYLLTFPKRHLLTLIPVLVVETVERPKAAKPRFAAPNHDYLPGELAKKGYVMAILD